MTVTLGAGAATLCRRIGRAENEGSVVTLSGFMASPATHLTPVVVRVHGTRGIKLMAPSGKAES